jgi:ketosteroid isomerase-like protein
MGPENLNKIEVFRSFNINIIPMKYYLIFILIALCSCETESERVERSKKEIEETEKAFSEMAGKIGIGKAFLEYADENAVLNRNNSIISGYDSIKEHFKNPDKEGVSLVWSPDFVEVSSSGDLGYTYGKFVYTVPDSTGKSVKSNGIFHTVWKRQKDGSWKFVWD